MFVLMKMPTSFYVLLACCLCLCACREGRYPRVLLQADSLAEVAPDSALRLLDGWADSVPTVPERVRMYYRLLTVKAADKAYVTHMSDSIIRPVVDYYEQEGDRRLLPEAYYYAGRVYRDLGDAPQALDYFERAAEVYPPQGDKRLLGKIYSQTGTLFLYQGMYEEALEMYRKAYVCNEAVGDIAGRILNLRDIGVAYQGLEQTDSVLHYFQQANELALAHGEKDLWNMLQGQLASLYIQLEKYDLAEKYLKKAFKHVHKSGRSGLYSMASKVYNYTGRLDSAVYCWTKLLACGTVYAKRMAHFALAQVAMQRKDVDDALAHFVQYQEYSDSVSKLTNTETIRQMHSLYNYKLREKENLRLKEEKERRQIIIYASLGTCFLLLALAFAYVQYVRRKKSELAARLEKANRIKDELQQRSEQFIRENEQKVVELEQKLREADDTLKVQLELQKKVMLCENKQAQAALERQKLLTITMNESGIRKELDSRLSLHTHGGKSLKAKDWEMIEGEIERLSPGFKEKLYDLYAAFSEYEYHVCLLIRLGIRPVDIAELTAHGKESVTSVRRRMYEKVFHSKGAPKDWDDIVLSL